jgi:hypothetical protein
MTAKLFVRQPTQRDGKWCVVIAAGRSPLSDELEVIPAGSREDAFQTYRRIMKERGRML